MKQYKHYSFDLWGTLIKSNPEFKKARSAYFYEHFNRGKLSHQHISDIFRAVGNMCNKVHETTQQQISTEQMYAMVLERLDYSLDNIYPQDIRAIVHLMDTLFLEYHPVLFDENTAMVLRILQERGATMSLLSNTRFAGSTVLKKVLNKLEIIDYFSFTMFSDEYGICKPASSLFAEVIASACPQTFRFKEITKEQKEQIVHVGDSTKCDIKGANAVGLQAFFVNSHGVTIKDLL